MSTRFIGSKPRPNWTIRKVNGQPFPILPQSIEHELYVVDKDSYEDTNGNLQRTILGEKDKFIITFPAIDQSTMNEILARVPTGRLSVEFEDYYNPDIVHTSYFYRGDTKKVPYMMQNSSGSNKYLYDAGFTFNLIAYNVRKL